MKDVKIIGAGLGGLATACLLAAKGYEVTVIEKNDKPGGKINEVQTDRFRFDTGPSLLTMPFILEELFKRCNARMDNFLTVTPLDIICRYQYPDGTEFTCWQDQDRLLREVERIAPDDAEAFSDFMEYSTRLYEKTRDAFLTNPLYGLTDLQSLNFSDFFKIDAFTTVSDRVDRYFSSPYLRQFFKRFATYNGSSPYQAPATLNVIPHVELGMGGYYISGGMYGLIEGLTKLAQSLDVHFHYGCEISHIITKKGRARGIEIDGEYTLPADLVVSNSDASETYLELLDDEVVGTIKKRSIERLEPSCSGYVMLLGLDRSYESLSHHNIYFSRNYHEEFHQIFKDRVMPDDPTIYIANTSKSEGNHAPAGGSNLFVLVNAPYLCDKWDWQKEGDLYAESVIRELENRGLEGLSGSIIYRKHITPLTFYHKYRSNKGSIYGTSSNNRLAAFLRPRNKARGVKGLYLVGGSTHPGGGIPLVTLSAFHAVELIERYEE